MVQSLKYNEKFPYDVNKEGKMKQKKVIFMIFKF